MDTIFLSGLGWGHLRGLYVEVHGGRTRKINCGLRRMLQVTTNLERLTIIHISAVSRPFSPMKLNWGEALKGVTYPKLKSLGLHGSGCETTLLVEFLERHGSTLKSVAMWFTILQSDPIEWGIIFDTSKNDLALEELRLNAPIERSLFRTIRCTVPLYPYVECSYTYLGHSFLSLLTDRILNKNLLAKGCSFTRVYFGWIMSLLLGRRFKKQ